MQSVTNNAMRYSFCICPLALQLCVIQLTAQIYQAYLSSLIKIACFLALKSIVIYKKDEIGKKYFHGFQSSTIFALQVLSYCVQHHKAL